MPTENDIATVEAMLATVEAAIAEIEAELATPAGAGDPGLKATLADLRTDRLALRMRLSSLKAAAVVVAMPAGAQNAAASPTAGGVGPSTTARVKRVAAFGRRTSVLARAALKFVGGGAKPAKKR